MQNVDMKVVGKNLVITVDLERTLGRSASGKSINIATTAGNKPVPGIPEIKVGLNVYKPVG